MSTITINSKKKLIVLEEAEYRSLIERLEDWEDLLEHEEAMQKYRENGRTDFREFYDSINVNKIS